jgi:ComF family protein
MEGCFTPNRWDSQASAGASGWQIAGMQPAPFRLTPAPWRGIAQHVAGMLAPPCCALCGGRGQWLDEPWGVDLCLHCDEACARWVPEPLPFDATFCLFRYQHPVDLMVTRLKFHGDLAFARVLGTLFAHAFIVAGGAVPECIVPLPLHRSRLRERGFCQTTEIAGHIARRIRAAGRCLPIRADLLNRTRATRAQSGLTAAERADNLREAFVASRGADMPHHVALLDDVLTTGHTATAAVTALRDAGVQRIQVWCCARA